LRTSRFRLLSRYTSNIFSNSKAQRLSRASQQMVAGSQQAIDCAVDHIGIGHIAIRTSARPSSIDGHDVCGKSTREADATRFLFLRRHIAYLAASYCQCVTSRLLRPLNLRVPIVPDVRMGYFYRGSLPLFRLMKRSRVQDRHVKISSIPAALFRRSRA
jgi:hypothetical protein